MHRVVAGRRRAAEAYSRAALVTGGGSGIGRACAARVCRGGGDGMLRQIAAAGGRARFAPCDVRRPEQLEAAVRAAETSFGALRCAVNSAGVLRSSGTLECTPEDWQHTLAVNLTGVWHAMRAAIAPMLEHGGGAIVNVADLRHRARLPMPRIPPASGGADPLRRLVQYAARSIRINAATPMTAPLLRDPDWPAAPGGALAVLGRRLVRYRAGVAGRRRLYGAMTIR